MPDSIYNGVTGGIGGIVGSLVFQLLAFFGIKERLDKLEQNTVLKDTCKTCSDDWKGQLNRMHEDIRDVSDKIDLLLRRG